MMKLLSSFIALLCICYSEALWFNSNCNLPPSLWCSTPQTAQKCQVLPQCKEYWRSETGPVAVGVYMESMCPGCENFITSQLFPTFQKIKDIINITYVPYGNAKESRNGNQWKYDCQHGPDECVGNIIEACAMDILKDVDKYLPFLSCIETSAEPPAKSAPTCASQYQIDYSAIWRCANGSKGNDLEHKMALLTGALRPPHQYVPWITINGVHTNDLQKRAQADLQGLICELYKGKKPAACSTVNEKHEKICRKNFF